MTSPFLHLLEVALAESDLRVVRETVRRTLRSEQRTLELGCGPGLFADLFANGDYVGVDPRVPLVDHARRHRPGAFISDDLSAVGLPDARFDQALAFDVLGPQGDAKGRAVLAELRRLLVKGGRALVIERESTSPRVERLFSGFGRIERRETVQSGFRSRVAWQLSTWGAQSGHG